MCYFVGAYPELKKARVVVNEVGTQLEVYEVEIGNLDHLVVTFS